MTQKITQFTITDPRQFDGDPYDVAQRAVRQSAAVVRVAVQSLEAARNMARNAEMERQLALQGEADAQAFEDGPHARQFAAVQESLDGAITTLDTLAKVAGYNPKATIGR